MSHRTLEWRDLVDDGRYLMDDNGTVAVPVDRDRLRAMVDTDIGMVIGAIEDETGVRGSLYLPADTRRFPVTEESW
ncbi:hypothetical protein ACIHDR_14735 [Nocardia sp. NPDC052278]|uniref:hypothetical protein n=1 Tax=unclassified Nocardia TaxID=2637762 RepID=UPI0036B93FEA